ncbi:GntR family transcriptional regulator [Parabacteroides sp. AM08-6]|uniref:GntR family transcriptional regulator n=1 Tax=Parabacteroides sp. AM08-6 TaxID=2292053 RepID=UPI000EFF5CED|nr:winged helix-turn-helix domain-containing protein [Parabacteroides sp. AM08-6]RHJ87654.1 GntR family transcriptional regulator [Parabacteroides sp. AM08-6]
MKFILNTHSQETIYNQLVEHIIEAIHTKQLQVGEKLLSVNKASKTYGISRDSIITTYKILQKKGIIVSIPGKGFFVNRCRTMDSCRVFILFDAMNQYKETLYRSLVDNLGEGYELDIAFHYYNPRLFDTMVTNAKGKYNHYVLMPHFDCDVSATLDKIPASSLLLLDAYPDGYSRNCAAVYQNFISDSYEGLKSIVDKLRKYEALHIIYNDKFQYMPSSFFAGAYRFSGEFRVPVFVEPNFDTEQIQKGHCYLAVSERDLAAIIKSIYAKSLKIREEIGIMSLDDTPLKEVLVGGITTLSTDFEEMGRLAASLIRDKKTVRIANKWRLMDRGSL